MLTEDIEEERVYIIVKSLVIQEELGDKAKVFTISLLILCINFKYGDSVISVYLIARRVPHQASLTVPY